LIFFAFRLIPYFIIDWVGKIIVGKIYKEGKKISSIQRLGNGGKEKVKELEE